MDFSTTTIFNKKPRLLASLLLLACSVSLIYFFADNNATTVNTLPEPLPLAPEIMPHERKMTTTVTNLGNLILNNPEVTMDAERGLLVAKLAVRVRLPNLPTPVVGYVSVTGKPRIIEASKQFFLTEATIVSMDLADLPQNARTQINKELTHAVSLFFQQYAAYAPLDNGAIQSGELSIEF